MYHVQVGRGAGQQFPQAGVWAQEAVCVMVARMVTKCGAMWRNCYTDTEVWYGMVARMVTKCGAMWRNCYTDTKEWYGMVWYGGEDGDQVRGHVAQLLHRHRGQTIDPLSNPPFKVSLVCIYCTVNIGKVRAY